METYKTDLPVTLDLSALVKLANYSVDGPIILCSPEHDLTLGIILDTEGARLTIWHGIDDPETFKAITEELSL
jgi:hypothetical protein